MLTSTRSRLVGLTKKQCLHSRVFSATPISRLHIDLLPAFSGKLNREWTPEIVTTAGIAKVWLYDSYRGSDNAESVARGTASLNVKDALDCSLLFTSDCLQSLSRLDFDAWTLQASTVQEIVAHHQRDALLRAGHEVSPTTTTYMVRSDRRRYEVRACLTA
jgi:hypothetical protein